MKININKVHYPVTVLGPGKRLGIWMQGCNLNCLGCISQDTWKQDADSLMPIEALLEMCKAITKSQIDGITISGGEPFEQPEALSCLLDELIGWRVELKKDFDILCYSGLAIEHLKKQHPEILLKLDAIIPEPFVEVLPRGKVLRGSTNQLLIPLTELGKEKYDSIVNREYSGKGSMQVSVDGQHIWYVGIPERTDMEAMRLALEKRGITQEQVSWRA
jgi:anaerobic ribonucleoside-triphosphate reductase activating protein